MMVKWLFLHNIYLPSQMIDHDVFFRFWNQTSNIYSPEINKPMNTFEVMLFYILHINIGIVMPVMLLIYMIFYIFYPIPHFFNLETMYYYFPNFEEEFRLLSLSGKEQFARDFFHLQFNMLIFVLVFYGLNTFIIILLIIKNRNNLVLKVQQTKNFIYPAVVMFIFVGLTYYWGWGLLPEDVYPTNKMDLSSRGDYIFLFINFLMTVMSIEVLLKASIGYFLKVVKTPPVRKLGE